MRITAYAGSDVGQARKGKVNEDSLFSGTTVFAVADGMGGHQAGEIASEEAVKPLAELDGRTFDEPDAATEALREAIRAANRSVVDKAEANSEYSGMGTTLTAVMVRDGRLHLAHVGDSRAYLLRSDEELNQLTTDHTLVEQLVQEGRLSRDEVSTHPQRSVITRAIGVEREVEVDTLPPLVLEAGDQVLLCSDGLSGPVDDSEIAEILMSVHDGDEAVDRLLHAANSRGGPDNITVVLLRVEAEDEQQPAGTGRRGAARGETAALGAGVGGVAADGAAGNGNATRRRPSIAIRTRPEIDSHDWAADMGRYGDRQGAARAPGTTRSGRGRRVLAVLTSVVVLLAVVGVGGWLVLSRAFFIGEIDGQVAIYNGVPEEVAGVRLYRLVERTGLPLTQLPARRRENLREGITVGSLTEARDTVELYRSEADESASEPEPTEGARGGNRQNRDNSP